MKSKNKLTSLLVRIILFFFEKTFIKFIYHFSPKNLLRLLITYHHIALIK